MRSSHNAFFTWAVEGATSFFKVWKEPLFTSRLERISISELVKTVVSELREDEVGGSGCRGCCLGAECVLPVEDGWTGGLALMWWGE